jgi:hypothetical protein
MTKLFAISVIALSTVAGCQSTNDLVDATQPAAIETALKRSRVEMSCPAANGTVLSRKPADPTIHLARLRGGGDESYEYTVGVEGCGKRQTAIVVCTEGKTDCVATGSRP